MDAGIPKSGVAVWRYPEGGEAELLWCGVLQNTELLNAAKIILEEQNTTLAFWVAETPQAYRHRRATHRTVERMKEALYTIKSQTTVQWIEVLPREWKKQVPKSIHNKRVLGRLTHRERKKIVRDHNAVDAVGIGLWYSGRMGTK